MPGFRPGHVPFAMVEAMYGQQASAEVINKLLEREANKQCAKANIVWLVSSTPSRSPRPKAAPICALK